MRSPVLATWVQASADQWSTLANTHTQPSCRVQAMVASVPHRRLGPVGMIVPSWARSRRLPLIRCGANRPAWRISRNTRFPPTRMPCSRRSRTLTLR